ncbi:MAG: cyclase family protein [Clostridiales bacterium]|nr:cyclase family protein [Clostridiales bacterium]
MIYDITQELFSCRVYPGDPQPVCERVMKTANGDICNLTKFSMCAHNGTHVDAPFHFIGDGKTIDQVDLSSFVGDCYVGTENGDVSADDAKALLAAAKEAGAAERILIKGEAVVTKEAADVFSEAGILLLGNESQTVGPLEAPMEVHLILLGKGIVLLEGIELSKVPEGRYFLSAAPLNLGGADGAPCRAYLIG